MRNLIGKMKFSQKLKKISDNLNYLVANSPDLNSLENIAVQVKERLEVHMFHKSSENHMKCDVFNIHIMKMIREVQNNK